MRNKVKKKIMPRAFSVLLILIMVLSMSVSAFAADTPAAIQNPDGSANGFDLSISDDGSLNISGSGGLVFGESQSGWTAFYAKYKAFIIAIIGVAFFTMVLCFVYNLTLIGVKSSEPNDRKKHMAGVLWTGLATAGLGSVWTIMWFFYSAI